MTAANDSGLVRLALWSELMMELKDAGISWWSGFTYGEAEWAQMATLAKAVDPGMAFRFKMVNAVVFILLAATLIVGGFVPLLTALYPNPADTRPLVFALALAATALLAIGVGLPPTMRVAAWLVGRAVRAHLAATPATDALWAKVAGQIRRMAVLMCGALVPGIMVLIAYDIDAGPIITVLKWIGIVAVFLSTAHTVRRRRASRSSE